jgi:ketosteroid isomerase-like protein
VEENAAIVRRLYEAFNRRDTEATRELMNPNIEWVNPEDAVEPGTRRGFGDYQGALRRVREVFREAEIEVDRLVTSGDRVATSVRMHVHLDTSGMDTTVRQSHLWTFRDGKATRFEWSTDPEHALKELPDSSS